jgi:low temperature requirement protein LtrA
VPHCLSRPGSSQGTRLAAWISALAIDYLGPAVVSLHGWRIAPEHFAERYGLVVLIALGESVIAIGVGAGLELTTGVVAGAALGVVVGPLVALLRRRRNLRAAAAQAGGGCRSDAAGA